MIAERLRERLNAQPFRPFTIDLADGRQFQVRYPESLARSPNGSTVLVVGPNGSFEIVHVRAVTELKEMKSMTVTQFRELLQAKPFQPFIIHLPGERQLSVPHPEYAWMAPEGRTAVIWQDRAFHIIDLFLVTDLEVKNGSASSKSPRRGPRS